MTDQTICVKCRKRIALPRGTHCFICRKNGAAAMYRKWKQEAIRKGKGK
jgi:hypothetical protein